MSRYIYDSAFHVTRQFREGFSWPTLREFVESQLGDGGIDADRVLKQIFTVDIRARFTEGRDCMVVGSLALPARVDPRLQWPSDFLHTEPTSVEQAYVLARTAGDLDLVEIDDAARSAHQRDPVAYGKGIAQAIERVARWYGQSGELHRA